MTQTVTTSTRNKPSKELNKNFKATYNCVRSIKHQTLWTTCGHRIQDTGQGNDMAVGFAVWLKWIPIYSESEELNFN